MEEINLTPEKQPNNTTLKVLLCIGCFFILFFVLFFTMEFLAGENSPMPSSYLTYNNYQEIENGMTYTQVVNIFENHDGELVSSSGYGGYTLDYYTWSNSSGTKVVSIGFENGKVCAKSQIGLR